MKNLDLLHQLNSNQSNNGSFCLNECTIVIPSKSDSEGICIQKCLPVDQYCDGIIDVTSTSTSSNFENQSTTTTIFVPISQVLSYLIN